MENMEFLKQFFGDKAMTYDEFVQAINAYNMCQKTNTLVWKPI